MVVRAMVARRLWTARIAGPRESAVTKAEDLLLKSINTVKCPNVGRMNIILTLMVALGLLTTVVAQDAKITSNRWESDTLIVSGTLSNPNGWPIEFVGFDKSTNCYTE
jgi:hypothetical protein